MSTFTAGPWVANDKHSDSHHPWRIESDANGYPNDGYIIAKLDGPDSEANARLIAAAPALFNAVEAICYALAASGVDSVEDSNDPLESLFYRAAEIRMKVVEG